MVLSVKRTSVRLGVGANCVVPDFARSRRQGRIIEYDGSEAVRVTVDVLPASREEMVLVAEVDDLLVLQRGSESIDDAVNIASKTRRLHDHQTQEGLMSGQSVRVNGTSDVLISTLIVVVIACVD